MDTLKFLEYAKLTFKIANFFILNRFLKKRSRLLSFLLYFIVIFLFLLKKFIQLQLLPISLTSVLNGTLASYNELILNQYCELFRRLGHEFSVRYDRPKYWKVPELRELVNNVYSIYASLYLSVNIYNLKLSQEGHNFYTNVRKLLVLLSNYFVKPTNLDLNTLVYIDIYDDIKQKPLPLIRKDSLSKFNKELDCEDSLSFLSLVHSENNPYVSDRHITNVLLEQGNLELFEQIESYCNNLFNISYVLKREGLKDQSRGFLSHLFSPPKYTFGNLDFLRSLMIYQFKGIHKTLIVKGWNFGSVDTFFYPDKKFINEMELKRKKLNMCLTTRSDHKYLISSLYGSDVYVNIFDNYRKVRKLTLCANPNGGCYELLAISPSDINLHVDNGRSAIIYNYPSVGLSRGSYDMNNLSEKSKYLVKYVLEYFKDQDDVNKDNKNKEYKKEQIEEQENTEIKHDNREIKRDNREDNLVLSFHGTSLGGYFAILMADTLGRSKNSELVLLHKTFGDLRKLSMHFVADFVGPLVRFFGLDVRSVEPFLKLDANKILITDIYDEIIPLRCSLAYEIAYNQVFPGVGKLSRSFMDYKYKTLQLLNESLDTTARHNYLTMSSIDSSGSGSNVGSVSSTNTYGSTKGSVSDPVVRIRLVKEMLSILGRNLNSSGQTLLNLLQRESELSTKDEVKGVNTFFTRLFLYGSMPHNSIPKNRETESSLVNMYSMLHRLDLNTNYFGLFDKENDNTNNKDNTEIKDIRYTKNKEKDNNTELKHDKEKNRKEKKEKDNKTPRKEFEDENKYLVKVPPKVAVYFSVLLDEVNVGSIDSSGSGSNVGSVSRFESDMVSVYSNSSDGYYFKKRVLFKDGEYYVDFKSLGNRRIEDGHLLEHLKNDLRNFGLSASRYRLTTLKLLSYFKLYSLVNVFNSLIMLNKLTDNHFKRVLLDNATGPLGQENKDKDELYVLYGLCKEFMYNLIQVIIEEQFGINNENNNKDSNSDENKDLGRKENIEYKEYKEEQIEEQKNTEIKHDKEKEFEYHLNKLKEDQRKYGVVIPQFVGHNTPNSHLDISLITSLSRYS